MHTPLRRHLLLLLVLSTALLLCAPLPAQDFKGGVARADITPIEPIRLAGYASRNKPSEGVEQPIFVKAIALQDSAGSTTLIVTADTIGTPRWFNDQLATRIDQELKIPRERFLFACSHSHSAPVIHGCLTDMYGLEGKDAEVVKAYTDSFLQKSFEVAQAALKDLESVKLSFGRSEAFFTGNRRQFRANGVGFGINPTGPVDRDVPVLRMDRADGSLKAVVFGYACHCTTPGATYEVSGDWAGHAQAHVELAYKGATALFITGCGADANPNPRGSMIFARGHGLQLGGAVARAVSEPMKAVTGPIQGAFARVDLPFDKLPEKSYYEAKLQDKAPAVQRYAKRHVDMLERNEPLPKHYNAPLQVLRFGETFTLVAISGEVVVDYSHRLHRELPGESLWTAGYCNDVFAYVPSMRILTEGGYEAEFNLIYYGLPTRFAPSVEDIVVGKVLELVKATGGGKSSK